MNATQNHIVMQVRSLGIAFGGLRAVDDVSFDVEKHRITTVIGPNGAGKSTLFNLISGALRPHMGQVLIEGVDMTGLPPERSKAAGLSRSFQITNLFPELTVSENLRLAAQVLEPMSRAFLPLSRSPRARAKTEEMLERFRLGRRRDELAGNLSHGDQRRLEIAVCLASEPKILLLDEPTQGMSHADTADTAQLVRSLTEDVSVLLIEHDIGLVMELSDHVVVMHQGRKLAEGPPKTVRADPAVQAAYFGHA
ncbi:MAG: transporter family protein [Hyphomicrobiales bacterium]|nr:transporter family protein [Hyphomicrobiales bacterium]